jgi:hypothetical protein
MFTYVLRENTYIDTRPQVSGFPTKNMVPHLSTTVLVTAPRNPLSQPHRSHNLFS